MLFSPSLSVEISLLSSRKANEINGNELYFKNLEAKRFMGLKVHQDGVEQSSIVH